MSDFDVGSETKVVYQGDSNVMSYGRSTTNGAWLKVAAPDEGQFTDAIDSIHGSVPVYLTLGVGEELFLEGKEFLLKAASSSSRSANSFRLEYDEWDAELYEQVAKWSDGNVELYVLIIQGEYSKKETAPSGKYSDQSIAIRRSPILINRDFLRLVGSEAKYISYIQEQKCVLCGSFWKDPETGRELNEAAHVREITGGAGTGTKPAYHAVPLHYKLHRWQHDHSMTELWLHNRYGKGLPLNKNYRRLALDQEYPINSAGRAAHAFFMEKVHGYMRDWVEHEIIEWAGVTRLSYVSPEKIHAWMCSIGAEDWEL